MNEFAISLISLSIAIVAYSISKMYQVGFQAIGTNPAAGEQIQGSFIVAAALMEGLGLACIVLAFMIIK